jgi:hypothetical protein
MGVRLLRTKRVCLTPATPGARLCVARGGTGRGHLRAGTAGLAAGLPRSIPATDARSRRDRPALKAIHRQLLEELDRRVPEFQNARGTAATFFGASDALEAGQKFVMGNSKINDRGHGLIIAPKTLTESSLATNF